MLDYVEEKEHILQVKRLLGFFLNNSKDILSDKAVLNVLLVSFPRTVSIILLGRNVSTVKMVILEMPLKVPAGSALAHIQTGTVKACKENQGGEERRKREEKK